ncbi:MAG: PAS domain S-box protein [Acidimicrobiales bacterium]|nr:PAS domain S-box protein [Acidimicrobiales bacterium]MBO0893299.1 PAS domain S-box protein [Acidimicrobiales bacterium]
MTAVPSSAGLEAELVAKASDAIVIADREGRILSWNTGAEAMFGYPAAEAIGATLDLIVPERLRARHWAGYEATMRTGHTSYADRLLAVPAVGRDGNRISIEFRVTLLGDEDGRPAAIGAVIRDVTERYTEDRRLRERLAELESQQGGGQAQEP